ncbi:DUF916 domain-containing protein [Patescibacteria group bacterium]|nr:DUF916 domain-containing protein [Patescibacteria group bacterium]
MIFLSMVSLSFVNTTFAAETTASQPMTQQTDETYEEFKTRMSKMGAIKADFVPVNPQTEDQKLFYYEIAPNSSIDDELFVMNLSDKENFIEIIPVYAHTNENGNLEYSLKEEEQKEPATWITLGEQEITLKPNEQRKIPIKIEIPPDTPFSTYKGGFAIQKTLAAKNGETFGSVFRQIRKIEINVSENPKEFIKKTFPLFQITVYFWIALVLFILSLVYYFISKKKKPKRL